MKKTILLATAFTLLLVVIAGATYFAPKEKKSILSLLVAEEDVSALTKNSKGIIIGKVKNILPSQKSVNKQTGDSVIFTDYSISVEKSLKDTLGNEVIIRLPGGTIGEGKNKVTTIAEDMPEFKVGEKVLVFLSKGTDGFFDLPDGYYTAEGWFQGKYEITDSNAGNARRTLPLDQLENEINSALQAK